MSVSVDISPAAIAAARAVLKEANIAPNASPDEKMQVIQSAAKNNEQPHLTPLLEKYVVATKANETDYSQTPELSPSPNPTLNPNTVAGQITLENDPQADSAAKKDALKDNAVVMEDVAEYVNEEEEDQELAAKLKLKHEAELAAAAGLYIDRDNIEQDIKNDVDKIIDDKFDPNAVQGLDDAVGDPEIAPEDTPEGALNEGAEPAPKPAEPKSLIDTAMDEDPAPVVDEDSGPVITPTPAQGEDPGPVDANAPDFGASAAEQESNSNSVGASSIGTKQSVDVVPTASATKVDPQSDNDPQVNPAKNPTAEDPQTVAMDQPDAVNDNPMKTASAEQGVMPPSSPEPSSVVTQTALELAAKDAGSEASTPFDNMAAPAA